MEKLRNPQPAGALECPSGRDEHEIRYREYEPKQREERR